MSTYIIIRSENKDAKININNNSPLQVNQAAISSNAIKFHEVIKAILMNLEFGCFSTQGSMLFYERLGDLQPSRCAGLHFPPSHTCQVSWEKWNISFLCARSWRPSWVPCDTSPWVTWIVWERVLSFEMNRLDSMPSFTVGCAIWAQSPVVGHTCCAWSATTSGEP